MTESFRYFLCTQFCSLGIVFLDAEFTMCHYFYCAVSDGMIHIA